MNENQENNLNGVNTEMPNTNPVEPTSTPEPVPPVAEPAPIETPVAPVAEPVPTEAPVTPVSEPTQPTVEPVQPSEVNVTNSVPPVTPEPGKKKSSALLVCLLVVILLGVVCYGLYAYTDIFKSKTNKDSNTTTTTTITAENTLAFKSFKDFLTASEEERQKISTTGLLVSVDDSFIELNPDMENKCNEDGDKVSFDLKGNTIEYTCQRFEYDEEEQTHSGTPYYWTSEVTVNKVFKFDSSTYITQIADDFYTNGKYYIVLGNSMSTETDHITIYSSTDNELYKNFNFVTDLRFDSTDTNYESFVGIIKNNVLYFVDIENEESTDTKNTCKLNYIDLSKDEIKVESTGFTSDCYVD